MKRLRPMLTAVRRGSAAVLACGLLLGGCGISFARSLPPQSRSRERWALIVGQDNQAFPERGVRAQTSQTDLLRQVTQILREQYGYHTDHIFELYNEQATQEALLDVMGTIFAGMKSADTLFGFVSLKTATVAGDLYIVPTGGKEAEPWTLVPASDFDKLFFSFNPQSAPLDKLFFSFNTQSSLLMYPACAVSSGRVVGWPQQNAASGYRSVAQRSLSTINYCALEAGEPPTTFSRGVLAALRGAAAGEGNASITTRSLLDYLTKTLRTYEIRMTRSGSSLEEFAFVPQSNRLEPYIQVLLGSSPPEMKTSAIDSLVKVVLSEAPDHRTAMVAQSRDPLLRAATGNGEAASVRARAVSALADLGDQAVIEPLGELLKSSADPALRKVVVYALGRLGGATALHFLREAFDDGDSGVRSAAIRAVGYQKDEASLPSILHLFQDSNDEVRIAALQTASTLVSHRDDFREATTTLLGDRSPDVRREAVSALGALGRNHESLRLIDVLQGDPDPLVRQAAALSLSRTFEEQDRPVVERALLNAIKEGNPTNVREAGAWALGEIGGAAVERALIGVLNKKGEDAKVRRAAVDSLGKLRSRNAVESLIGLLKTGTPELKRSAAAALGMIGDSRAIEPLLIAVKDPEDPYFRAEAENALKGIKAAPTDLAAGLRDPSPRVRIEAAQKLAQTGQPTVVPDLIGMLRDEDFGVRQAAINGLASFADPASIQKIGEALKAKDSTTRLGAATALRLIARPEAIELLNRNVSDSSPAVRAEVIRALGKVPKSEVPAPILQAAQDVDAGVRQAAAEALGRFKTPESTRSLQLLVNDSVPEVRESAIDALRRFSSSKAD